MSRPMPKIFPVDVNLILCLAGAVSTVLAEDGGSSLSIQGSSTVPENTQSQYTRVF